MSSKTLPYSPLRFFLAVLFAFQAGRVRHLCIYCIITFTQRRISNFNLLYY